MIRKNEAEKLPLNPAVMDADDDRYVAVARKFFCSRGYDMLNVDVSHQGRVVARYFADPVEEEFKGYLLTKAASMLVPGVGELEIYKGRLNDKPWQRIKLANLIQKAAGQKPGIRYLDYTCTWDMQVVKWEWESGSEDLATETLFGDVDYFENRSEARVYRMRREDAYARLQDEVHAVLAPIPEDFEAWCSGLLREEMAVFKLEIPGMATSYEYQCTACKGVWTKKRHKYRSKRKVACPHCGKELIAGNGRTELKGFYLISKARDNSNRWYEWYFTGFEKWDGKEWRIDLQDQNLGILKAGNQWGVLLYREYCGYSKSSGNGLLPRIGKGYIYPDFFGAEGMMTGQQSRCLAELARRRMYVNANEWIIADENPGLEYLLKGRYDRLLKDIFAPGGMCRGTGTINKQGKNIQEYLHLDKQRCLRLRRINGSFGELSWLRYERATGRKVSEDDMSFFSKHHIDVNDTYSGTRKMVGFIPSPTKFRHYLEKQMKLSGKTANQVISDYVDYIRMAEELGMNLSSEIFYKPKDLEAAHDECVKIRHEKDLEIQAKKIEKRFPGVPAVLKEVQDKYTYENDEYAIVVPKKIEDILMEGRALGHCIDTTDRYFERIQNHVTYLVFLRRTGNKKQSWYTLEIEPGGTVRQQRTTANRQNKEDVAAYMPFIREWQKAVRQRISAEDKAAAVRSKQIRIAEYKELREKKETVRRGLLAGQLLADVLEADLVEAI